MPEIAKPETAKPTPAIPKDSIFELRYRKGGIINTFHFNWPDKEGAIAKGREYCDRKGLKFIFVDQWLQDIQALINFDGENR